MRQAAVVALSCWEKILNRTANILSCLHGALHFLVYHLTLHLVPPGSNEVSAALRSLSACGDLRSTVTAIDAIAPVPLFKSIASISDLLFGQIVLVHNFDDLETEKFRFDKGFSGRHVLSLP